MKKDEIPQDPSALNSVTKEMCYAVDESGKYITDLSSGWEVKASALGLAWEVISNKATLAKKKVENGEASPIIYFMELKLMDLSLLSSYTGFWQWTIKRHMKPAVFTKLSDSRLAKYAAIFEVSVADLKSMNVNDK